MKILLNQMTLHVIVCIVMMICINNRTHAQTAVFSQAYFRYDSVEIKPLYPGGEAAMQTFIGATLRSPDSTRQGTVKLWFIVEKDGTLSNIRTLEGIGAGCDQEAERVVSLMPAWTPGKYKGKDVAAEVILNVEF